MELPNLIKTTKIVVTIVDKMFMWANRQTDICSSDFISVQCHELYWADNTTNKCQKQSL